MQCSKVLSECHAWRRAREFFGRYSGLLGTPGAPSPSGWQRSVVLDRYAVSQVSSHNDMKSGRHHHGSRRNFRSTPFCAPVAHACFTWLLQPPANGMPAAVDRYGRIAGILTFGRSTSMDKYLCLNKPSRTSMTCSGKRLAVPLDAENTRVLDNARALP